MKWCSGFCLKAGTIEMAKISKGIHIMATAVLWMRLCEESGKCFGEKDQPCMTLGYDELHEYAGSALIGFLLLLLLLLLAGHVARMGERRVVYRALVGKPEERRPLERPERRWEDNIKMDLREVGWRGHGLDQSGPG